MSSAKWQPFCPGRDELTWWCHHMETFPALLAICAGNYPVPGEFLAQRPVMRSFDVFFDLHLNKRLSKQSWSWWFEMLLCPLWCHCNANMEGYMTWISKCGRIHRLTNTKDGLLYKSALNCTEGSKAKLWCYLINTLMAKQIGCSFEELMALFSCKKMVIFWLKLQWNSFVSN